MKSVIFGLLLSFSAAAFGDCYAPWGAYVREGMDVIAYKDQRPTGGARCEYQYRRCSNGYLSGWYTYGSCQEDYTCYGTEFGTVYHGMSVVAYMNPVEYGGARCQPEYRYCQYGRMTGSYRYSYCSERP